MSHLFGLEGCPHADDRPRQQLLQAQEMIGTQQMTTDRSFRQLGMSHSFGGNCLVRHLVALTALVAVAGCSTGWPFAKYEFSCQQGRHGGTVPALITSVPEVVAGYTYDGFLDGCGDGLGRTLVFVGQNSTHATQRALIDAGCKRIPNSDESEDAVLDCVLSGNGVEISVEPGRLWAVPIRT